MSTLKDRCDLLGGDGKFEASGMKGQHDHTPKYLKLHNIATKC